MTKQWRSGRVFCATMKGKEPIDCFVALPHEQWCVHRRLPAMLKEGYQGPIQRESLWNVTHIETGKALVTGLKSERKAKKMLNILFKYYPALQTCETYEQTEQVWNDSHGQMRALIDEVTNAR